QAGSTEKRFHDVFIHTGGRAQHPGADIGNVGKLQQTLNGAIFAEGAVEHGEDDVHVDSAVAGTAGWGRAFEGDHSAPALKRGGGGTRAAWPLARTAAPGVTSGSPARRCRPSSGGLPCSKRSACSAVSQRPSLVMPMGTTSNLFLLMAFRTEAAESRETSCSP